LKTEEKGDTSKMVIDAGVNATGNKSGACPDEEEFVG
jgi:hypothetical protein